MTTSSTPSPSASSSAPASKRPVHRVEVRAKAPDADPRAHAVTRHAAAAGLSLAKAAVSKAYLIEADLSPAELAAVCGKLLADPVVETASAGAAPASGILIEIHPLPGVMDPAAQSVQEAIHDLTGKRAEVTTGTRYDLAGISAEGAMTLARRALCNPVIHAIHTTPFHPAELPKGHEQAFKVRQIPIRDLTDDQLVKMSREAHLFLSLDEMKALQAEYRTLGREPRDIELETIAQTWSEHCVHKTLKSTIRYTNTRKNDPINWNGRPGHVVNADGAITINNLLKSTVAAATFELIAEGCDWALSVFKDNSGVIALDDQWALNIKVETHNRPSAIEPYGGSATGIGGCIRDVIGTGLGAKPIASTNVFCVAFPESSKLKTQSSNDGVSSSSLSFVPLSFELSSLPPGCLPPKRILTDVVSGIRDYGNRMGIPTVSGGVYFDNRHVGNPLVFAGCIGLIPRDLIKGAAQPGDRIIALGGKTGRDGVHGATFSSAELESTASTEFAHAVQIGNAIEEKRLLDAILRARHAGPSGKPLYTGMTDCGAGGFSSAIGEMGGTLGAEVHLERAPLKYAGLTYVEIWISEAQERMVLSVPAPNVPALQAICDEEGVELADLGTFGTPGADLILNFKGTEVGRLPMHFLHDGIPMPTREAEEKFTETERRRDEVKGASSSASSASSLRLSVSSSLLSLLAHPNIASKHWIIRQYDHEVQGNVVAKPLVGPGSRGPGDAAVLEPISGSNRGFAVSQGLQTSLGDPALGGDAYLMVLASVDEVVRNLVCVGADPARIAILDNFCWPSCGEPRNLATLVRAAEGCYDAAKAYRTPFVSGKDSLNNQLRYTDASGAQRVIEIPPTLLITGLGIVPAVSRTVTMDAKAAGNVLVVVGGRTTGDLGGSHLAMLSGSASGFSGAAMPRVDLKVGPAAARAVAQAIKDGLVLSAHDCSEGGILTAAAEMLIASGAGQASGSSLTDLLARKHASSGPAPLGLQVTADTGVLDAAAWAFGEDPSRYLLEIKEADLPKLRTILSDFGRDAGGLWHTVLGKLTPSGRVQWPHADVDLAVEDLFRAWHAPLDW